MLPCVTTPVYQSDHLGRPSNSGPFVTCSSALIGLSCYPMSVMGCAFLLLQRQNTPLHHAGPFDLMAAPQQSPFFPCC